MNRTKQLFRLTIAFGTCALLAPVFTLADDTLQKDSEDPNQWVIPLGNYGGIRHSKLSQINSRNAGKLKVAWTMSTGTLRGQEGQPRMLSIGLHNRLIGRPGRIGALARLLDHIQRHDAVWLCNRTSIAQHWIATHPASAS